MKLFRNMMLFLLCSGALTLGQNTTPCPASSTPGQAPGMASAVSPGGTAAPVPGTAAPTSGTAASSPKPAAPAPGPAGNTTTAQSSAMPQAGSVTTTQARGTPFRPRAVGPRRGVPVAQPVTRAPGSAVPTTASSNPCMPSNNGGGASTN